VVVNDGRNDDIKRLHFFPRTNCAGYLFSVYFLFDSKSPFGYSVRLLVEMLKLCFGSSTTTTTTTTTTNFNEPFYFVASL
jgi:hypothetical protein